MCFGNISGKRTLCDAYIRKSMHLINISVNEADEETKNSFYDMLQVVTDDILWHDIVKMIGDWNAKIGATQEGEDGVVGRHGL